MMLNYLAVLYLFQNNYFIRSYSEYTYYFINTPVTKILRETNVQVDIEIELVI